MCTWIIKIVRDEFNGIVNDSIVISRSYRQSCPRVKNTPSVNDAVVIRIPFPRNILHCRRRQVGSPQVSPSSPVSVVEMVDAEDHFTVEGMDAPCAIMFDMSHSVCSVHLHKRDVNWRRHKGKATSLVTKIQSLLTVLINISRTFLDTHFSYSLVLKYAFKGGIINNWIILKHDKVVWRSHLVLYLPDIFHWSLYQWQPGNPHLRGIDVSAHRGFRKEFQPGSMVCHGSRWHGPQHGDLDGQLHFLTENIGDIGSDVKCRFVYVSPLGLVPRESSQTSCTLTSSSMVSQYGWSELYFTKHGGAFSIKHDLLMEALSASTILLSSSLLSCLAVILLAFWSYFTRHLST